MPIWRAFDMATGIAAGLAAVLGPGAAVRRPPSASRIRSVPQEAGLYPLGLHAQFQTVPRPSHQRRLAAILILFLILILILILLLILIPILPVPCPGEHVMSGLKCTNC